MDRVTVYADALPLETDVLRTNQYAMVGLAKLTEAVLGTPTSVSGFTLGPTSPASLSVILGPGHVYEQENLEATPYSTLSTDTHTIVKQGILLDPVTMGVTPPTTTGYSQVFLVEVQYADADVLPVVVPYYNAANPAAQFAGPGGDGAQQSTARKGTVAYQIKAGIAATTGAQVAPVPDAGWAALYTVTVAYGQTTVTAGNIAAYPGAPFIPVTLPAVPLGVQSGAWLYSTDQGAAGALVASLNPTPQALTPGMEIHVRALNAANGSDTINVAGFGVLAIQRRGKLVPQPNDWAAGDIIGFRYLPGGAWQITGLVPSDVLAATLFYGPDTSTTANTVTVAIPAFAAGPTVGRPFEVKIANTLTGAAKISVNGTTAVNITRADGTPTQAGDAVAGQDVALVFDGTNVQIQNLLSSFVPPRNTVNLGNGNPGTGNWTVPAGITTVLVTMVGGGGGGGGSNSQSQTGGGGGGAGYIQGWLTVTPGAQLSFAIGAGGAAGVGSSGANAGTGGTTSFAGGALQCTGGNGGTTNSGGQGLGGNPSVASGTPFLVVRLANGGNGGNGGYLVSSNTNTGYGGFGAPCFSGFGTPQSFSGGINGFPGCGGTGGCQGTGSTYGGTGGPGYIQLQY